MPSNTKPTTSNDPAITAMEIELASDNTQGIQTTAEPENTNNSDHGHVRVRQPLGNITHLLRIDPDSKTFDLPVICRPAWHDVGKAAQPCEEKKNAFSASEEAFDASEQACSESQEASPVSERAFPTLENFFKVTKNACTDPRDALASSLDAYLNLGNTLIAPGNASDSSGYASEGSEDASPASVDAFTNAENALPASQNASASSEYASIIDSTPMEIDAVGIVDLAAADLTDNKPTHDRGSDGWWLGVNKENEADFPADFNIDDPDSPPVPRPVARFPYRKKHMSRWEAYKLERETDGYWNYRSQLLLEAKGNRGRRALLKSRRISHVESMEKYGLGGPLKKVDDGQKHFGTKYGEELGVIVEDPEEFEVYVDERDSE
ncbi:hypothetical protein QBC43DRAFT_290694 [Cladorrhinum sp. PSN259]|nr:hypothetical protein QBC43DRAFT_290694 [Cladorrhinum sp. PSN259]